jgi:hypothetical protein
VWDEELGTIQTPTEQRKEEKAPEQSSSIKTELLSKKTAEMDDLGLS